MYRYCGYGLHIASAIECAWLPFDEVDSFPDVTVVFGEVPDHLENPSFTRSYYEVEANSFLLQITGVARYLVTGGNRIIIAPCPGAHADQVRIFLMGSAMGALLYQRGVFPLHGSAIETAGGAMVFIGAQGIGKSTLAANLRRKGYRLLSDDVCGLVRNASGRIMVLPAFPHVRLCRDAYEALSQTGGTTPAYFDQDKFILSLTDDFSRDPVELRKLYILAEHDVAGIRSSPVVGFHRVGKLLANLYRCEYLRGMAARDSTMRMARDIASTTTMEEILSPRDIGRIGELIERLESEWHLGPCDRVKNGGAYA